MNKQQIREVREQIQNDLLCLLDGLPDEVQTKACQIVVDNFKSMVENSINKN